MSSSISSSDAPAAVVAAAPRPAGTAAEAQSRPLAVALRTWLVVLVALVVVEMGVRAIEGRLSIDLQHIGQITRITRDLTNAGETTGDRTVMFLGNSLTRRGLDLDVLGTQLAQDGVEDLAFVTVYPDDTSVLDWLYLYESKIVPAGVPDYVVIGFGIWHLEDRPASRAQTYRLGRHFTSWAQVPRLFRDDVTSLADRANVLLSKASAAFANRERIARRVLSFLPHYQESARMINDLQLASLAEAGEPGPRSYERLVRLIRTVEDSGAELVLVAMPVIEDFEFDPHIQDVALAAGADFVDARDVPGLKPEYFEDMIHLDPATGAPLYSEYVADQLAPLLGEND